MDENYRAYLIAHATITSGQPLNSGHFSFMNGQPGDLRLHAAATLGAQDGKGARQLRTKAEVDAKLGELLK